MFWLIRALVGGPRRRRGGYRSRIPVIDNPKRGDELVSTCHVIDGDTIVMGTNHIRLAGIDAPELDRPYGQTSKWALVEMCKGRTVRAVFTSDTSHDRLVAECFLDDGRDLAAEMVKQGMALDWPIFSGGKYRQYEPPGIRRKLFEKARVVAIRHEERHRTVGAILAYGVEVRAHCHTCDLTLSVSPELLHAAYGDDLSLIGRLSSCRRIGCSGKAIFLAKSDKGFVPLL